MSEDKKYNASFDEKVKWLTDKGVPLKEAVFKAHENDMSNFFKELMYAPNYTDKNGKFEFGEYQEVEDADFEIIEPKQIENGER